MKQVYGEIGRKGGMQGRSVSSRYLFSGLLKYSVCSANISVVSGKWRGRSDVVYGCPQNTYRRETVCTNGVRIFRQALEEKLLDGFQEQVMRPEVIDYVIAKIRGRRSFTNNAQDVDGDGIPAAIDFTAGRNHYAAPPFVNLDVQLSKSFRVSDRLRLETLIEFFNAFNRANPSQVQGAADATVPFGTVTQFLPGCEGQVTIKLEF